MFYEDDNDKQTDTEFYSQRGGLVYFARLAFDIIVPADRYTHTFYIDLICDYLESLHYNPEEIGGRQVIINIPPRHMKSILCNVIYPAWLLGLNPGYKIFTATYSVELLNTHSKNFIRLIESDVYKAIFPGTRYVTSSMKSIDTSVGGYRKSTTVGGATTGAGGNLLIIDDPINAASCRSTIERNKVNQWFGDAFYSRRDQVDTLILIIMQRLHVDDLSGYLLHNNPGGWVHLNLPAICEEDVRYEVNGKVYERCVGDLLSGERFPMEELEKIRASLGDYSFAGQYQQRPAPLSGSEIDVENFCFYRYMDSWAGMNIYMCVDPAGDKKVGSDYTAMVVIGLNRDNNMYILDIVRERLNLNERVERVFALHRKYKFLVCMYEKYGMQSDVSAIYDRMEVENYRFSVYSVGGMLNKNDRIRRLIPMIEARRVYLPESLVVDGIDLVQEFLEVEAKWFPSGRHDDILDAISRIYDMNKTGYLPFPSSDTVIDGSMSGVTKAMRPMGL
jgi:predicted phage terminase large subunit-like protein